MKKINCPICDKLMESSDFHIVCYCGKEYVNVAIYKYECKDTIKYYILVNKTSLLANYIAISDLYLKTSDLENFEFVYGLYTIKMRCKSTQEAIDKAKKLLMIS